jgi:hypothetical protein
MYECDCCLAETELSAVHAPLIDMQGEGMTTEIEQRYQLGRQLLESLARLNAREAGIMLSEIWLDDGRPVGCTDVHILSVASNGRSASVTISHAEMDSFLKEEGFELASAKVRKAVSRLQELLK